MFGSHLSISGGLHNALLAAEKLGFETLQLFTTNQRTWAAKPLDPAAVTEFRAHAERLGIHSMVAHDSYLINLASKDDALWEKSIASFREEMRRCDQLGIRYLVAHPGAHCGSGEECGIGRIIEALNRLLEEDDQRDGQVTICLETTAGQGSCLGCTFEHLASMRRNIHHRNRIGFCVDTCHILAAGYDITTEDATRKVLAQIDATLGLEHVKVWHLNDSKKPVGSRVDRHEHIGRGCVGLPAFRVICQDPRFRNKPKILETAKEPAPDGRDWDAINVELLRALAAGQDAQLVIFPEPKPKKARSASAGTGPLSKKSTPPQHSPRTSRSAPSTAKHKPSPRKKAKPS